MSEIEQITDRVDNALDRLITQFKGKPNIETLLTAFVDQNQEKEDALFGVLNNRWVDTAVGDQLDGLGAIVGQIRGGRTDAQYRLAIQAKIAINTSKGTANEVITIYSLVTGATIVQIYEYFPGHVEIYGNASLEDFLEGDGADAFAFDGGTDGLGFGDVFDSTVGGEFAYLTSYDLDALYSLMDKVLAGGVRLDYLGYFPDDYFSFDGDPDGLGFGDVFDVTVGGGFATIATP